MPLFNLYFKLIINNTKGESVVGYAMINEVVAREVPSVEVYPPVGELLVERGGVVYAQCRVLAGSPEPVLEWRRSDGLEVSRNVEIGQGGSLLAVKNAGDEEFGEYVCVAKNDAGRGEASVVIREQVNEEEMAGDDEKRRQEYEERLRKEQEERVRENSRLVEEARLREQYERERIERARQMAEIQRQRDEEAKRTERPMIETTSTGVVRKPDARTRPLVEIQEGETVRDLKKHIKYKFYI